MLTANAITSPSNTGVLIFPSNGNSVQFTDHTQTNTFAQFNDNGTYILGNGFVSGSATMFAVPTVTASSIVFPNGLLSTDSLGTHYKITNTATGFAVLSAANVLNVKFANDGSGQLNAAIHYDAAGNLTVNTITTTAVAGSSLALTGNLFAADIYASRSANSGAVFYGTNGTTLHIL